MNTALDMLRRWRDEWVAEHGDSCVGGEEFADGDKGEPSPVMQSLSDVVNDWSEL